MSAGGVVVQNDVMALAPMCGDNVNAALDDCNNAGYDAIVYEALRSEELQQLYWKRGRPPTDEYPSPVTNVPHANMGWHYFGMAVDVISASKEWSVGDEWRSAVTIIFKKHGLYWGGDWPHFKDLPHYQCVAKHEPDNDDRALIESDGIEAVWKKYNVE